MATNEEAKRLRRENKRRVREWKNENPSWASEKSLVKAVNNLDPGTKKIYLSALPFFFAYIGKTPDDVYMERRNDLKSEDAQTLYRYEDIIEEYKKHLVGLHYAKNTIKSYLNRVAGFFSNNRLGLDLDSKLWDIQPSEYMKGKKRTKRYPTKEEVIALYEVADNKTATGILFGYQTGLAPVDVVGLTWENLNLDLEGKLDDFVYCENVRKKTNIDHMIVLGPDLLYCLRNLWTRQGRPKGGPVFKGYKDGRLAPDSLSDMFRKYAVLALGEKRGEELNFKDLRDSFNEVLLAHNVTGEVKDILFGHKRESARGNYGFTRKSIVDIYREVYPSLTVDGWQQREKSNAYNELADEMKRMEKALDTQEDTIRSMKLRNERLNERLGELEGLKEELTKLRKKSSRAESDLEDMRLAYKAIRLSEEERWKHYENMIKRAGINIEEPPLNEHEEFLREFDRQIREEEERKNRKA